MNTIQNLGVDPLELLGQSQGLLDWIQNKSGVAQRALQAFSVLGGIIFVIIQGVMSRGSMGRIIVSGIAAGVFVFIIFNVTSLRDRVDNEVNSAPATAVVEQLRA